MRGEISSIKEDMDNKQIMQNQELDRPGKLMVSGIPKRQNYMEKDLEQHFSPFGRLTEVSIIRDKRTKIPRGFAFVTYENPKDSADAIRTMEGKDLGGECKVHCEQARIGLKMSQTMKDPGPRGDNRGHESHSGRGGMDRGRGGMERGRGGMDRGRGGMDRGRGGMDFGFMGSGRGMMGNGRGMMGNGRGLMDGGRGLMDGGRGLMDGGRGIMDRGRGIMFRGRGLMDRGRGAMGMPPLERAMYDGEGFDYREEEIYEEFLDQEPPPLHMLFPPPGSLSMRGAAASRGRRMSQSSLSFRGKKGLLPDPLVRGGRVAPYPGSLLGPAPDDLYGDDANEEDYYGEQGNPYAEAQDEAYPEEVDYPSEEYYEQEWNPQPRGRGGLVSRGRGLIPRGVQEARAQRQQEEDYDFEAEAAPTQRSRAQALVPRRGQQQTYGEELYDEEDIRLSGDAPDPYSRGRGRSQAASAPSASSARLGRGKPAGRSGAAPVRRPLLEADPYADEEPNMYERVLPAASLKGGARAVAEYGDDPYADPYGRRLPAGVSRQPVSGRSRAAMISEGMYPGDRSQPKALMEADAMNSRKPNLGSSSRVDEDDDDDDYQGQGVMAAQARAGYPDGRRQLVRRGYPDGGMIEEMYDRMEAETNAYASFPPRSRGPGNLSDPYNRKRPIAQYEDPEMGGHGMSAAMREYEDLRSAAIGAVKRDRQGAGGGYDPYGRQEAMFRGGM